MVKLLIHICMSVSVTVSKIAVVMREGWEDKHEVVGWDSFAPPIANNSSTVACVCMQGSCGKPQQHWCHVCGMASSCSMSPIDHTCASYNGCCVTGDVQIQNVRSYLCLSFIVLTEFKPSVGHTIALRTATNAAILISAFSVHIVVVFPFSWKARDIIYICLPEHAWTVCCSVFFSLYV